MSRCTELPEANKLARSIRSGRTIAELAWRYDSTSHLIIRHLVTKGWSPDTGTWVGGDRNVPRPGAPLPPRDGDAGSPRQYVGGGDNPTGVPTVARPFTERPRVKFTWPVVVEEEKTVVAVPPQPRYRRPARTRPRKISDRQEAELAQRYLDGESSVVLGRAFGVNERTIRTHLRARGVPLRSRSEALRLRYQQSRASKEVAR